MRVLLDTHVWLWMTSDSSRLPPPTEEVLADAELVVSVASVWEITVKHALGKLELPAPPTSFVPSGLRRMGCTSLDIQLDHTLAAVALPPIHRDPFDRMLIAQSRQLGIPLCSGDRVFGAYDVDVLWA